MFGSQRHEQGRRPDEIADAPAGETTVTTGAADPGPAFARMPPRSSDLDNVAVPSPRGDRDPDFDDVLARADARRMPFQFCLDPVSEQQIGGWIQECDRPSRRCAVVLKEGERVLARATASLFRAELTWLGIGDGCHSFTMPIPPSLRDGREHMLEVFEEDSGVALAVEPIRWRLPEPLPVRDKPACNEAPPAERRVSGRCIKIPYSCEIAFGRAARDIDAAGGLPSAIARAEQGLLRPEPLQAEAFAWGAAIRADGCWADPEDWGTWCCHAGGEIAMALPATASTAFYVVLRLRVSGPLANRSIRVLANNEPVWEGILGRGSRNIALRVRQPEFAEHGAGWHLRLDAQVDLSAEMRRQIAAADSRVPTIGFERLIVVPSNDMKTSLDIMYALLP